MFWLPKCNLVDAGISVHAGLRLGLRSPADDAWTQATNVHVCDGRLRPNRVAPTMKAAPPYGIYGTRQSWTKQRTTGPRVPRDGAIQPCQPPWATRSRVPVPVPVARPETLTWLDENGRAFWGITRCDGAIPPSTVPCCHEPPGSNSRGGWLAAVFMPLINASDKWSCSNASRMPNPCTS